MEAVKRRVTSRHGGRRLERRLAGKNITYDSHKRNPDSIDLSAYDESDGSNHSLDDWSLNEYRLSGADSVEEMNNVCKYLGLASLGITSEVWEAAVRQSPGGGLGDDQGVSYISEDQQDLFFVTPSPGGSSPSTSPREVLRDPYRAGKSTSAERNDGYARVVLSPAAEVHKIDREVVSLASFIKQDRETEYPSRRSVRTIRSATLPCRPMQSEIFSEAGSSAERITPKPSVFGVRPRDYSENGTTSHIQRVQSHPAGSSPSKSSPARETKPLGFISRSQSEPVVPSEDLHDLVSGEPAIRGGTHSGSRATLRDVVHPGSTASQDMARGVELPTRSDRDISDNREPPSHAKTDVPSGLGIPVSSQNRVIVQAPRERRSGLPLARPPPMSILTLPSVPFSTHDLMDSLAPGSPSVAVAGRVDSADEADSDQLSDGLAGRPSPPTRRRGPDANREVEATRSSTSGSYSGEEAEPSDDESDRERDGARVEPHELHDVPTVVAPKEEPEKFVSGDLADSPVSEPQKLSPSRSPQREEPVGPRFPWYKGELLGAGSFGQVFEAVDSEGQFFAVKEVSLTENDPKAQQCISQLEQEIELLSGFKHENIVQYLGTERKDGKLYIFLELVSKGALASLCKKYKLSISQITAYTRQILKGLKYLHDMNIVHRDIKCANILVDVKGTCKLADFGLAKQISDLDQLKSCKGSAYWMAPEVIDPKKTYWLPADIWSLGCSVLEMATGCPPFGDQEWYRVLWKVGHGEAPPIPDDLSEDAKDFIRQCLEINPSKRPSASSLLMHPFVAGISSTHSSPMLVVNNLQTIAEERSADFTRSAPGTPARSLANAPLSNGHAGH